ncbi:MAG: sugar (pentulose or hexulose) kinase [Halobacteriales archaeon]|jgi:sugar (pentulose or hexulose) kinase
MYYLGIDLHKDDSRVAVLDDDGEVVEEARFIPRLSVLGSDNRCRNARPSREGGGIRLESL